jgi:hypothetical protein
MKRSYILPVVILIIVAPALAQRIQNDTGHRNRIIHLQTALNHLTIIEVNEPVTMVAAGSPSFKVEWKENKVFVQPTEADVATNLFIWTASERLNYELEPAGAVEKMDFAIDETPRRVTEARPAATVPPVPSPTEVLLAGKPVRLEAAKRGRRPVEVVIRDLYENGGRLLVRYAVRNQSDHVYTAGTPQVFALKGVRYPQSLYGLTDAQLGEQEASHLKATGEASIPVADGQLQSSHVEPGQETVGVVAVKLPSTSEPTVLRFQFPKDESGEIAAYLIR